MVYLPKNTIEQKLNRDSLSHFNELIKRRVEELYNSGTTPFIVQDGPPYANSSHPHLGHYLNKSLKDAYVKYYLSNGYKVRFSFGWDCHGLPIENKAKSMPGNLLENCAQIAHISKIGQKNTMHLFGVYSTEPDYMTLNDDFVQREKEIFNKLQSTGCIYKKMKPTWYSPQLNTVLANSEIEYKNIEDESVYFFLPAGNIKFLVWTTTEWTVAGNQAICLNPNID